MIEIEPPLRRAVFFFFVPYDTSFDQSRAKGTGLAR